MCFSDFSFRNTFCVSVGKTLWKSQNMSLNGFFRGKHHPAPAVRACTVCVVYTCRFLGLNDSLQDEGHICMLLSVTEVRHCVDERG